MSAVQDSVIIINLVILCDYTLDDKLRSSIVSSGGVGVGMVTRGEGVVGEPIDDVLEVCVCRNAGIRRKPVQLLLKEQIHTHRERDREGGVKHQHFVHRKALQIVFLRSKLLHR